MGAPRPHQLRADDEQQKPPDYFMYTVRKEDPQLTFIIQHGIRLYQGLNIGEQVITIDGKKTTVEEAVKHAMNLSGHKREEFVRDLFFEVGELFRIRRKEELVKMWPDRNPNSIKDLQNPLGLGYNTASSDPMKVIDTKSINCFSGAISLASVLTYLSNRVRADTVDQFKLSIVSVPYTIHSGVADEIGHAIVSLNLFGKEYFLDTTNASALAGSIKRGIGKQRKMALTPGYQYPLGPILELNQQLFRDAALQNQLFNGELEGRVAIHAIAGMHPVLFSYYVHAIDQKERGDFVERTYPPSKLKKVKDPVIRFKIAVQGVEHGKRKKQYARIALSSLNEIIKGGDWTQLPFRNLLEPALELYAIMSKTKKGKEEAIRSHVFFVVFRAATKIDEKDHVARARFGDFFEKNWADIRNYLNSDYVKPEHTFVVMEVYAASSSFFSTKIINDFLEDRGIDTKGLRETVKDAIANASEEDHKTISSARRESIEGVVLEILAQFYVKDGIRNYRLSRHTRHEGFLAFPNTEAYLCKSLADRVADYVIKGSEAYIALSEYNPDLIL